jgi:hypothetical protein
MALGRWRWCYDRVGNMGRRNFCAIRSFLLVLAGAAGMILATAIAVAIAWIRVKLTYARYIDRSVSPGDNVNPLDDSFNRKRIKLTSFVSPYRAIIQGKTFDQCELFGPAVVVLRGGINMNFNEFHFCDFIAVRNNSAPVTGISFVNVTVLRSKLYGLTFLVPESQVHSMIKQGIPFITLIPETTETKQNEPSSA